MQRKYLAVATSLALAASLAYAEERTSPLDRVSPDERFAPGQTVADRAQPEYDPIGVRLGSFVLFPQFAVTARHDDNVYFDTEARTDWVAVFSPTLRLESDWSNHRLSVDAGADVKRYNRLYQEDAERLWLDALGRLDITRDTKLTLQASTLTDRESRGSPDDAFGEEPAKYRQNTTRLSFEHRPGRLFLQGHGQFRTLDYDDVRTSSGATINNDDRDRDETELSLTVGYEITPQYDAFVRYVRGKRDYDAAVDDAGRNRDSTSDALLFGVALDISGVVQGEVALGAQRYDYDDSRFDDTTSATAEGLIYWHLTPLTSATFQIARSIGETTATGSSGYVSDTLGAKVEHELLRNLLLEASATFSRADYEEIDRSDDTWRWTISGEYRLDRNVFFGAGFEREVRSSDVNTFDYERNLVSAWGGVRY